MVVNRGLFNNTLIVFFREITVNIAIAITETTLRKFTSPNRKRKKTRISATVRGKR